MTMTKTTTSTDGRDVILMCVIDAMTDNVFGDWTEPTLRDREIAPAHWPTQSVETNVRVGGSSLIVMRGPDGTEFPNRGVYLEVVKNKSLVFTDAYTRAWEPSDKPFMTVIGGLRNQSERRAT